MTNIFAHFRFAQPAWFYLLVPALLLLLLRRNRGATSAVVFPNLSVLLSLGQRVRNTAWNIGIPLAFTSIVCGIFALARPVWRSEFQNHTGKGIDIVIAFDVSISMGIEDFIQNGSHIKRIELGKDVINDFINRRTEDRIGLVAFAARPQSVCPITLDHEWLKSGVQNLRYRGQYSPNSAGTIYEQGTAIGSAIAAASSRLDSKETKTKVIVLMTDGANNSGKIAPIEAAKLAKVLGIKIYTVAIGTPEGRVSREIQRFPREEFDVPTLKEIAQVTGGEFYRALTTSDLRSSFQTIDNLEKTQTKFTTEVEDEELFFWPLASALLSGLFAAALACRSPLES